MLLTSAHVIEMRALLCGLARGAQEGLLGFERSDLDVGGEGRRGDPNQSTADIWVNDRSGVGVLRSVSPIVITDDARPAGGGPPARSLTMIDGTNSGGCLRSTTAINGCSSWRHLAGLSV